MKGLQFPTSFAIKNDYVVMKLKIKSCLYRLAYEEGNLSLDYQGNLSLDYQGNLSLDYQTNGLKTQARAYLSQVFSMTNRN